MKDEKILNVLCVLPRNESNYFRTRNLKYKKYKRKYPDGIIFTE